MEIPSYLLEILRVHGLGPLAVLHDAVAQGLDPPERVELYLKASEYFWEEGLRLINAGDLRQGGEKIWNSVVQLVKAVAEARRWPHDTHRLVWAAVRRISQELGDREVVKLFAQVEQLHVNFYEGHLERWDVDVFVEAAKTLREKLGAALGGR
ncbi:PaREP1/PaREP8 domain containing family protein [Pyrobaculum islandicum DSM 4184]|uniref:PaREP1/PaREP8 domain containing family protein n=1 Tax=Pyrobaculum islandicum (strain DSM 4184 / JCM 9189 / GEO3) TaxID=384616 RepID=A1RUA8_PYRIL|nr:PaREP1 family protein [Pyrobaculum islandicum]ABL88540.1 PaREP1/PaREP8 domain containing family protein [Pyrobaculum islandicum DSM 4184]